MQLFAKVFSQIFESSIAEDYTVRHVFMDLLVLADIDGVIDKTHEAIARITNVPLEQIQRAISELEKPDPQSRSDLQEGRRLIRLDDHRDWGWQIVNYEVYREIRDEEARRAYFREKKRQYRAKSKSVTSGPTLSNGVLDCPTMSTQLELESEREGELEKKNKSYLSAEPPKKQKPDQSKPKDWAEHWTYVVTQLGMNDDDAKYLWNNWKANGFTRNGRQIKDWKAAARAWKAGKFFPSQKQK